MKQELYDIYTQILKEQLVPAQGCTEPIAIAYAGAILKDLLGGLPEKIDAKISRNIIKNTKSVIVPNTGGLKGIEAAIAAGVVAGDSSRELEVIAGVTPDQYPLINDYLSKKLITVERYDDYLFGIKLYGEYNKHTATVEINETHTHVSYKEVDGEVLLQLKLNNEKLEEKAHEDLYSALDVNDIIEYVNTVPIKDIKPYIKRQIEYNVEIAEYTLQRNYGANVGRTLINSGDTSIKNRAKAMAAAGSDGRMSGCELPVIIVCGSGNQGITASVPIFEYALCYHINDDKLYRAVALADLLAIRIKSGIGTLSAFCGAVIAGCAAGAGICYMLGGSEQEICDTLVNSIAVVSGIVCDGAKPSCAAKIASSVDAGILGYEMAKAGQRFYSGDGLVTDDIEETIKNIARLGKEGMRDTDNEIMDIMLGK